MNIQIFGTKKSADTRKAERFFKERGIKFQYVDLKEKGLSKGEFQKVCHAVGGLDEMKERNIRKAVILYDYLDRSRLFKGTVRKEDRSVMNVPFVTGDKELDAKFVAEAAKAGLVNLKGHRSVGGMRASIYNAMPKEGVEKLVAFMREFEEANA